MVTFLTFYTCQLKFINFKLYNDEGYAYPPALEAGRDDGGLGLAAVQVRKVGAAAAPALEDVRHTRLLLLCAEPLKPGGRVGDARQLRWSPRPI